MSKIGTKWESIKWLLHRYKHHNQVALRAFCTYVAHNFFSPHMSHSELFGSTYATYVQHMCNICDEKKFCATYVPKARSATWS